MSCPRVQLTPVLSLLGGLVSLSTLLASTLSPSWRSQRLASGGRTQANLTVTDGLWERCVRVESGSDRCIYRDVQWYRTVDQLDIRLLQLGLPLSLGVGTIALFLTALGVCQTACTSSTPGSGITHCSVNSAGCFLISGVLYLLSCALCLSPTLYLLFHTRRLNQRFGPDWTSGIGVLLALGSAAGLLGCAGLQTLWYCLCRGSGGDGQLWQPLLGPQGTPIYLGPPPPLLLQYLPTIQALHPGDRHSHHQASGLLVGRKGEGGGGEGERGRGRGEMEGRWRGESRGAR
ncbi:claudin-12 [Amblyraja radiata]|uniref:claudin-12 n=1 Tax=Amblyraja radiata TaxID=386614 RepID=UPI0014022874|nr:claudin-12 [Amblyraja radiata]